MNKRIRELAEQAKQFANETVDEKVYNRDFTFGNIDDVYNTKFAELIVQECMKVMIDNAPFRWPYGPPEKEWDKAHHRGIMDSVRHVREHFGIEE